MLQATSQVRHDVIYGRGIPETFHKIICIRNCQFESHAIVCLPFVLNRKREQFRSFSSDASFGILPKIFGVELLINNSLKTKIAPFHSSKLPSISLSATGKVVQTKINTRHTGLFIYLKRHEL